MCTTRVNAQKPQEPNFHLRTAAESQQSENCGQPKIDGQEDFVMCLLQLAEKQLPRADSLLSNS